MTNTKIEQWEYMVKDIKRIRQNLVTFICSPEYQQILDRKTLQPLRKALERIDKFRSDAENRMIRKLKPEGKEFNHVFYGGDAD